MPASLAEAMLWLLAGCLGWTGLYVILKYPIMYYDAFLYHLPVMVETMRAGRIATIDLVNVQYYPFGWELVSGIAMLFFRGDFGVSFFSLVSVAGLCLAVYRMTVLFGGCRMAAWTAAILTAAMPQILEAWNDARCDLPFAFFFLTGTVFLLHLIRTWSPVSLLYWMLSAALMFTTKTSALPYGMLQVAILLAGYGLAWGRSVMRNQPGFMTRTVASLIIWPLLPVGMAALFLACFWSVRNLYLTGNPLGDIGIQLFGRQIFPGPANLSDYRFDMTTLPYLFDPSNALHWRIVLREIFMRAGPTVCLAVPILAIAIPVGLVRRRYTLPGLQAIWLGVILGATAFLYALTPFSADNGSQGFRLTPWMGGQMRFAIPFFSVGCVVLTLAVGRLRLPGFVWVCLALAACAWAFYIVKAGVLNPATGSYFVLSEEQFLTGVRIWLPVFLVGFSILFGFRKRICEAEYFRIPGIRDGRIAVFLGGLVLGGIILVVSLVAWPLRQARQREYLRATHATVPSLALVDRLVPLDGRLGYLNVLRLYPFYGPALSRTLIDAKNRAKRPAMWFDALRNLGIGYVIAEPGRARNQPEWKWLQSAPERAQLIYGNSESEIVLYRIR